MKAHFVEDDTLAKENKKYKIKKLEEERDNLHMHNYVHRKVIDKKIKELEK